MKKIILILLLMTATPAMAFDAQGDTIFSVNDAMTEVWDRCFGHMSQAKKVDKADTNRVTRALYYAAHWISESYENAVVRIDTITVTAEVNEYDLPADMCKNFLPSVVILDSTTNQIISLKPITQEAIGQGGDQGGSNDPNTFCIKNDEIIIDPANVGKVLAMRYSAYANKPANTGADTLWNVSKDYKTLMILEACSIILGSTFDVSYQDKINQKLANIEAAKQRTILFLEKEKRSKLTEGM